MKKFIKTILKNSSEHKIMMEIQNWKPRDRKYFLKIHDITNECDDKVSLHLEFQSLTVQKMQHDNILDIEKCIQNVIQILFLLKKFQIIHQDVHLENIVYNSKKKQFYVIDYGISKKLAPRYCKLNSENITNWYDYYYYHLHEDMFQFFWNLFMKNNQSIQDFRPFREKIAKYTLHQKQVLKKNVKNSLFYNETICKKYFNTWFEELCKEGAFSLVLKKKEKILLKFLLQRLYFVDFFKRNKNIMQYINKSFHEKYYIS